MAAPDTSSVSEPDQEGAARLDEPTRIDRRPTPSTLSGLAVAALASSVAFTGFVVFYFSAAALVWGASALVFGMIALPRIRQGRRRGLGFVIAALVILVGNMVLVELYANLTTHLT
jgi:hypothetical protein